MQERKRKLTKFLLNVPLRLVASRKNSLVFLICCRHSICCVFVAFLQDHMLMGAFRSSCCNIYNRLVNTCKRLATDCIIMFRLQLKNSVTAYLTSLENGQEGEFYVCRGFLGELCLHCGMHHVLTIIHKIMYYVSIRLYTCI